MPRTGRVGRSQGLAERNATTRQQKRDAKWADRSSEPIPSARDQDGSDNTSSEGEDGPPQLSIKLAMWDLGEAISKNYLSL